MGNPESSDQHPPDSGEDIIPPGPEADLREQAQVVEEQQHFEPSPRRDEVSEADWYEQSIAEELDDEDR